MNLITIKSAKSNFFDRAVVIEAAGKARVRVLSKFGAYVRTRARSSIRKRKKPSKPGQPPSSHLGLLKQFLFFGYDRATASVVIGPALINRGSGAPETLEHGGTADVEHARWVSGPKYGNRRQRITETHRVKIAARPFMAPALRAELPRLPAVWKDSIRK